METDTGMAFYDAAKRPTAFDVLHWELRSLRLDLGYPSPFLLLPGRSAFGQRSMAGPKTVYQ